MSEDDNEAYYSVRQELLPPPPPPNVDTKNNIKKIKKWINLFQVLPSSRQMLWRHYAVEGLPFQERSLCSPLLNKTESPYRMR